MRATEIVRGLDDRTAVRFLEFFGRRLFDALDGVDVRAALPESVRRLPHFTRLQALGHEERKSRLSHSRSVALARALLEHFARSETTDGMLVEAWQNYRDDSLGGEATLYAGYAEALVTLVATGGDLAAGVVVDYSDGKRESDPRLVEALSAAALTDAGEQALSQVELTCFHSTEVKPETWYSLAAYVHVPDARPSVEADGQEQMKRSGGRSRGSQAHGSFYLKDGADLTVVPELPGFRFNPEHQPVTWEEDWHCVPFRMRASPDLPGFELERPVNGRVSYYAGPILVGEVPIWTCVTSRPESAGEPAKPPVESPSASMYQAVFVSYSHKDAEIVDRLESAYSALGLEYLRDVRILRSGEEWDERLLERVEEADLFQLCWSSRAKDSVFVEREWRHALELGRKGFIRPTFWEDPLPKPPKELDSLHFSRLVLV